MSTYGIKVTNIGKDITSTDPRDVLLHSEYPMFKFHGEFSDTVTINAGGTSGTATVAHGLDYVPAYIAYATRSDDNKTIIVPSVPFNSTPPIDYSEVWADDTNIYFKYNLATPYNQISYYLNTAYTNTRAGYALVGYASGDSLDFGIQFASVDIDKDESLTSASMDFKATDTGSGTQNIKMRIWGIDVDNLSDFGSDLGQDKTTATHDQEQSHLNDGDTFGINVINEIREITTRSGWSNGNNLGFYVFNNGTSTDGNNYVSSYPDNDVLLKVVKTGTMTVDFKVIVFKDKISD